IVFGTQRYQVIASSVVDMLDNFSLVMAPVAHVPLQPGRALAGVGLSVERLARAGAIVKDEIDDRTGANGDRLAGFIHTVLAFDDEQDGVDARLCVLVAGMRFSRRL